MITVLLIGGPADGRRVSVEHGVKDIKINMSPSTIRTPRLRDIDASSCCTDVVTYLICDLRSPHSHELHFIATPAGVDAVVELIAGYRKK